MCKHTVFNAIQARIVNPQEQSTVSDLNEEGESSMANKADLTISKEQQVTYTTIERSYLISRRDWSRLSKTIERLRPFTHYWLNAF